MNLWLKNNVGNRTIEWFLAVAILSATAYSLGYLWKWSHLPQPFFYEPYDIYADWFNTAYWARDKGTYDSWTTLYPPVSFVFLRVLTLDQCYPRVRAYETSPGLAARDCDWLGLSTLWGIFLLNILLVYLCFRKIDKSTAIPRTICVAIGWPMLNGLERGNLMLVAFTCVVLAFGPLVKSARLRWLAAGLAVNFKVYLIAAIVPLLIKRRWLWVEGALLATIAVYVVSFAILGRGSPVEIFNNLRSWSSFGAGSPLDMWSATTYKAAIGVLESETFPAFLILGSRLQEFLLFLLPFLQHSVQMTIVAAVALAWTRPEVVPPWRLVGLGTMMALITSEAGGYTTAFITFFVMMEPWRGVGRKYAIVMSYILAIAIDIKVDQVEPVVRDTYFRDSTTIVTFYLTAMPFARPFLIMTIPFALACVTIREVWFDIRRQGWRHRCRLRRDAPIMRGEGDYVVAGDRRTT